MVRLKKYDEAVADAKRCIELKPDFSKGYNRLANALKKQGKLKGALDAAKRGLGIKPDDAGLKKTKSDVAKKLRLEALTNTAQSTVQQERQNKVAAIQQDLNEISKRHQSYRSKILSLKHEQQSHVRNTKRSEIVEKQIDKFDDETNMYNACGKMFIKSSKKEALHMIRSNRDAETKHMESVEKQLKYNQVKLNECDREIKELLRSVGATPK